MLKTLNQYLYNENLKETIMRHNCLNTCLFALIVFTLCFPLPLFAQSGSHHRSSNHKYETISIKHRDKRGFNNHGRVLYHHVTDADVTNQRLGEIGNVKLQHGSRIEELENGNINVGYGSGVRRIHSAISLTKGYTFKKMAKIGNIIALDPDDKLGGGESIVTIRREIKVH